MSAEYVRRVYSVDYKVGDRLTVDGRPGLLVSFPDQYLGIRLDGDRHVSRCHPTWEVAREAAAIIPGIYCQVTLIVDTHLRKGGTGVQAKCGQPATSPYGLCARHDADRQRLLTPSQRPPIPDQ